MATLQNIRNKSGLLLAVIGIAMLAFILGDLLKSTNSSGGGGNYVGEVLNEDVLIQTFQQKVDEGIENWKNQNQQTVLNQVTIAQIRDQIWSQLVRDLIMEKEFNDLGIDISDDEFFELLQGVNVHPEISKVPSFQDPSTGAFDRTKVLGYLKQIDQDQTGESRERWINFQKYLVNLIKNAKYNSLVSKAMFTTNSEAEIDFNSTTVNAYFDYVAIPFSSVADSDIEVTDKEIENYYSKHKSEYEQSASKDIDFVVYNVVPSEDDINATIDEIEGLMIDFKNYDDYELMARRNSDNTNSNFLFTTKDALKDTTFINLFDKEKGSVYGPYIFSPGVYRIVKLAEVEYRPDSVEARHILLKPSQSMSLDSVNKAINLFKIDIERGGNFSQLAQKYSEDQGSAILGGDLGWFKEGAMVDEFNEVCFTSKKGVLSIVTTQFGVHLIEVTKRSRLVKKAKFAYIDRSVEPSTETFNNYYSEAARFAGKILNDKLSFDTVVQNNNLIKRSDMKVTYNKQNIVGVPNSRELVRWLKKAKVNSVSEVFQFDNSYVVAYVTNEYLEGVSKLEDIKEQIISLVKKEKKALKITEGITDFNLSKIALDNSTNIVSNKKATFSNSSIDGIGLEPKLVGSIFSSNLSEVSPPIVGANAVYVIKVNSIDQVDSKKDFTQQKMSLQSKASSYANSAAYNALQEAADVKDNRGEFY